MSYDKFFSVLELGKSITHNYIKKDMIVIDATMGNGNDTIELAKLVGENGIVYGFDIQKVAIENSKEKLKKNNLEKRVKLILDSHENFDKYIKDKVDFIIYNLGYLPRGNKEVTTKYETTIESLKKGIELLKENGLIVLIAYPGHEAGFKEEVMLREFFKTIDQKHCNILRSEFINQKNNPPVMYIIEKANKTKI